MIRGLAGATIWSEDVNNLLPFYRDVLGLTEGIRTPGDADWKRLTEAGVEFVEKPTDYDRLRIATLKDPEGNLIQLLQRAKA
jgi:hypothetical protein